jgi:2-methylfumaryl-CoA isomerase
MSGGILAGLSIVEGSAFVAAPLGGMTLAQLGADVIRFDPIDGGLDAGRWPLDRDGNSLFWAGLNKGKRSIRVDFRAPEGQEILTALITRGGADNGIFLTNFPARGWLDYEKLKSRRADLIMVALTGNADGSSEVDYTVQPATGFPEMTGPRGADEPTNSVLPAWDIAMGNLAAVGILAAERHRRLSAEGALVRLALSDVALASVANLGRLAEAELGLPAPQKDGNYLYGAFGRDFRTKDDRRVMVVGLTGRQWRSLKTATGIETAVAELASESGVDLDGEGGRYAARDRLAALLEPWFAERTFAEVEAALTAAGVAWGPYRSFDDLVRNDPRASAANPMFAPRTHAGGATYLTPASPLDFSTVPRVPPLAAPRSGEHTDEILADLLRLSSAEIGRLHDQRIVAGPSSSPSSSR